MMVVTAHPDDEASSFGGSLRLYQERGVETCIVCLTPGQAASYRGGARNDQELCAMRREEFAAACRILKVSSGIVLDYPDGQLHRLDMQRVVSDLTLRIREFRPQVLLTFDPAGSVTGHTDHTMASVFATLAFHWAGRSNRFPDQLTGSLTATPGPEALPHHCRLHSAWTTAGQLAAGNRDHRDWTTISTPRSRPSGRTPASNRYGRSSKSSQETGAIGSCSIWRRQ